MNTQPAYLVLSISELERAIEHIKATHENPRPAATAVFSADIQHLYVSQDGAVQVAFLRPRESAIANHA